MKLKSKVLLGMNGAVIPIGSIFYGEKVPGLLFPWVYLVNGIKYIPEALEEVELEVGDKVKIIGNTLSAPDKLDNREAVIHKIEPHSTGVRYGVVVDKNSSDFYMRMVWWYLADNLEFISHEGLSTAEPVTAKVPVAPKKPRRCLNPA